LENSTFKRDHLVGGLPTGEGWLYLAGIKDMFTYELVGYAMGECMKQTLTATALWKAVRNKRTAPGLKPDSSKEPHRTP
jgi:hypothetical protein